MCKPWDQEKGEGDQSESGEGAQGFWQEGQDGFVLDSDSLWKQYVCNIAPHSLWLSPFSSSSSPFFFVFFCDQYKTEERNGTERTRQRTYVTIWEQRVHEWTRSPNTSLQYVFNSNRLLHPITTSPFFSSTIHHPSSHIHSHSQIVHHQSSHAHRISRSGADMDQRERERRREGER